MSDYPPPPPTQDPGSEGPGVEAPTSRYQPYPGPGQYQAPQYAGYAGSHPAGGQPPGGPPPGTPAGWSPSGDPFRDRLARRPEPRFTTALAGLGVGMALFGILIWGTTYYGEGLFNSGGDSNRNLLGAGLSAVVVVLGYVLAIVQRRGPLATAGAVAAGVGVPLALAFLTIDPNSSEGFNFDAIFWVSVVIWALSYAVVPGTRGHTFFVFLIASGLVEYVLVKNTKSVSSDVLNGSGPTFSGLGTIAAIGLIFGLGYYAIAFLLDRTGHHGPATGLVYPAFNATATGIIAWTPDIHRAGAGVLTVVIGLLVCWYGGQYGRRITCFAAAGAVAVGVVLLVYDAVGSDGVQAGVSFLLIGLAVVVIAALLGRALGEPHDMDPEAVRGSR